MNAGLFGLGAWSSCIGGARTALSRVAMLAQKTSHFCEVTAPRFRWFLFLRFIVSFISTTWSSRTPERAMPRCNIRIGSLAQDRTTRIAEQAMCLPRKLCWPRKIKRKTRVGAGKWLEPTAKGQEGDANSLQNCNKIVMRITYINHKSLILMHLTDIPAAPKGRKTPIQCSFL